jgi:hypothetical protein
MLSFGADSAAAQMVKCCPCRDVRADFYTTVHPDFGDCKSSCENSPGGGLRTDTKDFVVSGDDASACLKRHGCNPSVLREHVRYSIANGAVVWTPNGNDILDDERLRKRLLEKQGDVSQANARATLDASCTSLEKLRTVSQQAVDSLKLEVYNPPNVTHMAGHLHFTCTTLGRAAEFRDLVAHNNIDALRDAYTTAQRDHDKADKTRWYYLARFSRNPIIELVNAECKQ